MIATMFLQRGIKGSNICSMFKTTFSQNLIDGGNWGCSDIRPSQTETPVHERDRWWCQAMHAAERRFSDPAALFYFRHWCSSPASTFRDICLATTTILNPHTHSLTHACRSLVFFLIFESTHSVLYRAILLSSTTIDQPFVEAVCKAFSCTNIDGQRGCLVFIQPCPAPASLFLHLESWWFWVRYLS